jgi:hypothetical protein
MALQITYGLGGYCKSCDNTHNHPLYNIVEQYEVDDLEAVAKQQARQSALTRLRELGLTDAEITALGL